jgi:hypothetical protein
MKRILIPLLLSCLLIAACQDASRSGHGSGKAPAPDNYSRKEDKLRNNTENEDVIDRHPGHLIYTKHARCRMDCRHIDESEVTEILEKGRINYRKSEPAGRPDPKYALEGTTHDGQQVRIIFAPAKRGMVVITVIDLGSEWSCNCK